MALLTQTWAGSSGSLRAGLSALLLLFVASGNVGAADIYRWVDENGVVNYSQSAPEGARGVERVQTSSGARSRNASSNPGRAAPPAATQPAASRQEPQLTPEQQALREALEVEEREQLAQIAAERADVCRKNRDLLADLTQYARIRVEDPDGSVRILPDEERRARIDEVQQRIVEYCTSS